MLRHVTSGSNPGLTFYHPLRRQPVMCATEKWKATDPLFLSKTHSLIKLGNFWYERGGRGFESFFFFLFTGIVRRKLLCVCPLVAQSRCPNQIPQHFLLPTQQQTAQNFHCEKVKGQETSFMWLVPRCLTWRFEKGTSIKSQIEAKKTAILLKKNNCRHKSWLFMSMLPQYLYVFACFPPLFLLSS